MLLLCSHSMVSTSETYQVDSVDSINYGQPRQRLDSTPVLMLPAPLSVNGSVSTTPVSRHSEDQGSTYVPESSSRTRLIPSPPTSDYSSLPQDASPYSNHPMSPEPYSPSPLSIESYVNRAGVGANGSNAVLRQGTVSSQVPSEMMNPYYNRQNQVQAQMGGYDEEYSRSAESEDTNTTTSTSVSASPLPSTSTSPMPPRAPSRGVTLSDNGPVPGPDGVRRVARPNSRRPTSQQPATNRYSRSSMYGGGLPPGAAPPRPYGETGNGGGNGGGY